MTIATWVAAYLAGSFVLAVIVGRHLKRQREAGDAEFLRNLPNPNRDNDRDDLGGDS